MSDLSDKEATTVLSSTSARRTFTPSKAKLKCSVCWLSFDSLNELLNHKESEISCRYEMDIGSNCKRWPRLDQQVNDDNENEDHFSFDGETNVNFELSDEHENFEMMVDSKLSKNNAKLVDKNPVATVTTTTTPRVDNADAGVSVVRKRRKYNKHKATGATLICESNTFKLQLIILRFCQVESPFSFEQNVRKHAERKLS